MTSRNTKAQTPGSEGGKRAIIFARTRSVPPDAERDRASLAAQRQRCEQIAASLGAEVSRQFLVIGGTTGPLVRQIIERMLQAVGEDGIDYLITTSADRLTRRTGELTRIKERLAAAGAELITEAGRVDIHLNLETLIRIAGRLS